MNEEKRYKKGYFIEMGLVIGMPAGIPIGLALGSIAYGPLIGVLIGLFTCFILEKKLNKNPFEQDPKQRLLERKFGWIALVTGLVFFTGVLLINVLK